MPLVLEGIGNDWVVTRRPGGKPELTTFKTFEEFRLAITRLMSKDKALTVRPSTVLPTATPPSLPVLETPVHLGTLPPGTDCRDCGACCGTQNMLKDVHVKLDNDDFDLIPKGLRGSLVVSKEDGKYLKTKRNSDGDNVCVALSGTIGDRCKCGIYSKRPMVCRLFEPGSPECLLARKARGM
jgi:Fe-S-cluster containining protein